VRVRKNILCNARRLTQIRDVKSELRFVFMPPCGVKRGYENFSVKRGVLRVDTARETGSLLRLHATLRRKTRIRNIFRETGGVARGHGA